MLNPSDKELDRLAREAAERFQPEEEISSWEKIAQQLDNDIGNQPFSPRGGYRMRPLLYSSAVILIGGLSYFIFKSKTQSHKEISTLHIQPAKGVTPATGEPAGGSTATYPQAKTGTANEKSGSDSKKVDGAQTTDAATAGKNNTGNANIEDLKKPDGATSKNNNAPADHVAVNSNDGAGANKLDKNIRSNKTSTHRQPTSASNAGNAADENAVVNKEGFIGSSKTKKRITPATKDNIGNSFEGKNSKAGKNLIAKSGGHINKNGKGKKRNLNKNIGADASVLNHPNFNQSASSNTDVEEDMLHANIAHAGKISKPGRISDSSLLAYAPPAKQPEQRALQINNPLHIGILYAPDFTNVGTASNSRLSSNFGLSIGYDLSSRISINTGVIYTAKKYAANGEKFHYGYNVPPTVKLDYLKGECNMWEIPLTVRYNFSTTQHTNYFVNAGLSTYLMKKQHYLYYYHNYWDHPVSVTDNTPQNYWFGVFDFSVGFEQRIGKNLSLQVEPFIKVPLQGVGLGQLQLNSYGVNFSIRLAPILGRSR